MRNTLIILFLCMVGAAPAQAPSDWDRYKKKVLRLEGIVAELQGDVQSLKAQLSETYNIKRYSLDTSAGRMVCRNCALEEEEKK